MKISPFIIPLMMLSATVQAQVDSFTIYRNRLKDSVTLNKLIDYSFDQKERRPDSALKYSLICFEFSKRLKSTFGEARSLTNLGTLSYAKGNYAEALRYHTDGLKIWERIQYYPGIATNKNNISDVYNRLKNPDLAERYLKEAIAIATEHHLEKQLGLIDINLGNFYFGQGKFRNAFNTYQHAISINNRFKAFKLTGTAYSNGGGCLFMLGKIDSAIFYYRKAITMSSKVNDLTQNVYNYGNLGEALAAKGQTKEAIKYYELSTVNAKSLGLKDMLVDDFNHMIELHKKQGAYDSALRFTDMRDSVMRLIMNGQVARQLAEVQTKYDTAKKEEVIREQQNKLVVRNIVLIAVLFVLLLTALLFHYRNRRLQLLQASRIQQEIMYQQDIATKGVIEAEERERKRIAADLHDGVGQLFSAVRLNFGSIINRLPDDPETMSLAEKTLALVDESCNEVRTMAHQMMPNILLKTGLGSAIREFVTKIDGKQIKVNLETTGLNERLSTDIEIVLYRVIQECVNNVIKHAKATRLDIQLHKDEMEVSATIEDNGVGFDTNRANVHEGIGLKNIATRLNYLKGTVDFSSTPGKGTLVAIYVPLNKA